MAEHVGLAVQTFIKHQLGDSLSAKSIKRLIDSGHCRINERLERYASFKVALGDKVSFWDSECKHVAPSLTWERARVLYEDAHFILYNKPPGINCDSEGLEKLARTYEPEAQLVHRLDRDTSGVILLAKSSDCFQRFVDLFRAKKVHKHYLAIVTGVPQKNKGVIHNFLGAIKKIQGQVLWGEVTQEKGLEAITKWQKKAAGPKSALLQCEPVTGRTHQIRVHLSGMGYPIVGDCQYGWKAGVNGAPLRCCLHAERLQFKHPYTGQEVDVTASMPDDMVKACQMLGLEI